MIRILRRVETDTTVSTYFDVKSGVYNIEFGTLSEQCRPMRIAKYMIVWVDDNGIIGELESIGPREVIHSSLDLTCIESVHGIPAIKYVPFSEEPVHVINTPEGFTLLLSENAKIDMLYRYKGVSFLASMGSLVGVCWSGGQADKE